jgi:acyl-CoA thioester hydrolase
MSTSPSETSGSSASPLCLVPSPVFSWKIRVYWEDTDAGGVVYHASYLRFLERARTEWLRARGIEQQQVRHDQGVIFVVRDMSIEFLLPARLDEELDVTLEAAEIRSASMTFSQRIVRRADGAALLSARVRAACIDAATFKPCRIPSHLFTEKPKA